MKTRRLGNSGLEVSEVAFGSWLTLGSSVDGSSSAKLIEHAYDIGINFFDTADVYARGAAEEILGRSLRVTLSDKFPNTAALERARRVAGVEVAEAPVDATAVPADLPGVRSLFSALHHFPPDLARKIFF